MSIEAIKFEELEIKNLKIKVKLNELEIKKIKR